MLSLVAANENVIDHQIQGGCGERRWVVTVATVIACIMGGVLLHSFSKRVYILAGVSFTVGFVIDLALVVSW